MIKNNSGASLSIKQIKEKERLEEEARIKALCEKWAVEKFSEAKVKTMSNENKGLWYLPILDEDGNIEKLAIMRPINRHILSYASTKITDEGLYAFIEAAMRECFVDGDAEILEDDEYFIPAAQKFNSIIEGKKAALVKR